MVKQQFITPNGQGRKYEAAPNWQAVFLIPAETTSAYDFVESEMGYLGGPPLHSHPHQDETHYVLQGELRYQIGEQVIYASSGDCIHIPNGTAHAWINLHQEPARIIAVLSPGSAEGFFKTLTATTEALAPEALIKLGQQYGTEVIGPPLVVNLLL